MSFHSQKTWQRVFDVNINGTFVTCQRWLRSIRKAASNSQEAARLQNVSLVIMGSESGRFGVPTMAAYAAGKSAVQYGLLYSLAQDAPRLYSKARVNAVAPGPVDTDRYKEETLKYGKEWYWKELVFFDPVRVHQILVMLTLRQSIFGEAYPSRRCGEDNSVPGK